MNFFEHNPSLETYWRSIILLGRNVASYKFSLAKTLLEYEKRSSFISLENIALPFALNICEHLKINDKQHTGPSNKFLDYCREFFLISTHENPFLSQIAILLTVFAANAGFVNLKL